VCYAAFAVGRLFRSVVVVFLLFILASSVGSRRAQAANANAKAEGLVNQAVELRRNGDDEGALGLLLQAYALGHTPRATGQLGLCEQALGRWADAEIYLTESLKAEADPWVKKSRRALEDALAIVKAHIARIEIQGEPEGAEIWVNGALAGKVPLSAPVRVSAGEIEVELRAPGFVRETKTMRLEAGQYQRVILRASKQPVAAPALPPPAPTSPQTTTVVVNVPEQRVDKPPAPTPDATTSPASGGRLALKWVAWGVGAAALGVGIYGAVENANLVSQFDAKCAVRGGNAVDMSTGLMTPGCTNQMIADYESKGRLGVGGFVAAGAFVVTGFALWLTEPSPRPHDAAALSCVPSLGAGLAPAAACVIRF
jgi:hypothetical protein